MALLRKLFIDHPASVDETYLEHLATATSFGKALIVAGIACVIHGLLPALFVSRGSDTVKMLNDQMLQRAPKGSTSDAWKSDTRISPP